MKKRKAFLFCLLVAGLLLLAAGCGKDPAGENKPEVTPGDFTEILTRPGQEVKVVTFNVDANESTIKQRSKGMLGVLTSFDADSVGVQECRGSWNNLLRDGMKEAGYGRIGVDAGGNEDALSQYFATYIFYKEDKYRVVDSGTFWMSETPDIPSKYDGTVDCNRTCVWAILENKTTGFRYVHMNLHLDWMNMEVNQIQVQMVQQQIERFEIMGYPVFATGDYNADEGCSSYVTMLKSPRIGDASYEAEKTEHLGTYPDYGKNDVTKTPPIDYCFVTKEKMQVREYHVITDKPKGVEISDHHGLFVRAEIPELPAVAEERFTPSFKGEIRVEPMSNGAVNIFVPRAEDPNGIPAKSYLVTVTDASGKNLKTKTVNGEMFRLKPSEEFLLTVRNAAAKDITVTAVPYSLLGQEGKPLVLTRKGEGETVKPEEPEAPDLLCLVTDGEGRPQILGDNPMRIVQIGKVSSDRTERGPAMKFEKSGNYKIPDFKQNYSKIKNGFTVEFTMKTGAEVQSLQAVAANFHAGGFGFEIEGGKLIFSVFAGGAYVGASCEIAPNTEYRVAGVYDGKNVLLYVNGFCEDAAGCSGTMGFPTVAEAEYLCLGADSDATGKGENPADCLLYYVKIWSKPLTEGNVLFLDGEAEKAPVEN